MTVTVDHRMASTKKNINENILSVAFRNKDLCTRCGTCVGVCPTGALSLDEKFYPKIDYEKCDETGLCGKSCPGGRVSFKYLTQITFNHEKTVESFDGHVKKTFVGYSTDSTLRNGGAGGGVITSIMWDLLKNTDVDGCIVARMNPQKPWIGEPYIARNYQDLLASQGSKYMIIPINSLIKKICDLPGKYAYAALPCQVHGYRLAAAENPKLKEKISSVIGLFCGGSLEPFIVKELLQMKKISTMDLKDFQFRGGEWPGKIRAIKKDGRILNMHYSNYKDGAYNYFIGLYMPKRCQTCIDGSCEFSDLSVSDAWTRDEKGDYKFQAHSKILVRTDKGLEVIRKAAERKSLLIKDVSTDISYRTHKMQTKRKAVNAPLRVARLKRKGCDVPTYDRGISEVKTKEIIAERAVSLALFLGQYKLFRYPIIKFLTSKYSIPLIKLRLFLKKKKYRKN